MSIVKAGTKAALAIGWITANWPILLGAAVLAILLGIGYRVTHRAPSRENTAKATEAVRTKDRTQMLEVLAENDKAEQGIDNSIKAAEEVTRKSIEKRQGRTNAELAAEIEDKFGVKAQ